MLDSGRSSRIAAAGARCLSRRGVLRLAAGGGAAGALLAACGEPQVVTVERVVTVQVPAPALPKGTLTVYSGRSESLVDPILTQFGDISGVDVQVKYAGTPAMAATLLEEGERSPADVFYAQDPGGLGAVQEMLAPLPEHILNRVPAWARHTEGRWVGISGRARTVVYNTDALSEDDLPDDMFGFTDPRWKGRIGWAPPNGSFLAMVTGMRFLWGEARTEEWLTGIRGNEPIEYPKNTPQVAAAAAGEIDVGFVNHYYLHRFLSVEGEAFPARNYHVRGGGPGAMVMVSGAGVLSTAQNPEAAQALLAFLLSVIGQRYFVSTTFEYPLAPEISAHPGVTPLDAIERPQITPADLTDLVGTQDLLRRLDILP